MIKNQDGFTLIEIIAVLILISLLGVIAYSKFDFLGETAAERMADQIVQQMNTEAMDGWVKAKFELWTDDEQCWKFENYSGIAFNGDRGGGVLVFKGYTIPVERKVSTAVTPATWKRRS